jgi:hypothetical protein
VSVFDNEVLSKIIGPKKYEASLNISAHYVIGLLGNQIKKDGFWLETTQ